jgi:hypothetical protein
LPRLAVFVDFADALRRVAAAKFYDFDGGPSLVTQLGVGNLFSSKKRRKHIFGSPTLCVSRTGNEQSKVDRGDVEIVSHLQRMSETAA